MRKPIWSMMTAIALAGCGHAPIPAATAPKAAKPAARGTVTARALPGFGGTASASVKVRFDAAGRALLAASPLAKVVIELHQGGKDGPVAARVEVTRDQAVDGEVLVRFQGMANGAYTALLQSRDALDMLLRVVAYVVQLVAGKDVPIAPRPQPAPAIGPDEEEVKPMPIASEAPVVSDGSTRRVKAGDDLQAAIDAAKPGDTLVLDAGATFTGAFTLPNKPGAGYVTIAGAGISSLPEGQRVTPADAARMPKLVSTGKGEAALATRPGAHHYRLLGLEITAKPGELVYDLVRLGSSGKDQDALTQVPHHLTLDRCYLHAADDQTGLKRGIALNSADTAIESCWLAGFKAEGQDSQAIGCFNGPGPFLIENNHLEGAGENVLFGGSDPSIPDLVPSDITFRRNHVVKPLAWKGSKWSVKNLFELKNARRVVAEGNLFENNWGDAQVGFAIVFTPRNQDGHAPWCRVEDVAFRSNVVRHTASAVNILGTDDLHASQPLKGVHVVNNLFDDVDGKTWNGAGLFFQLGSGGSDVVVDHNTAFNAGSAASLYGTPTRGVAFTNNLMDGGKYGLHGDAKASGNDSIAAFWPGAAVRCNMISGVQTKSYPADNFYPASIDDAGFLDRAGGMYRLRADSPYVRRGTDGKDVGVDFDALAAATGELNDAAVD
jgi:hypothetical protein